MQEKERENAVNEQQIYLDYAANTPVDQCVLNCYCQAAVTYMGNPNSKHYTGLSAKEAISRATAHMAELLQVQPEELIFTSGASESNNLAIKGIAHTKRHTGKHIISTCLEHSSVSGSLTFLQEQGYEIDLVQIQEDGTIDLSHLKRLLRQDTILVSICAVDSELGTVQPISEISKNTYWLSQLHLPRRCHTGSGENSVFLCGCRFGKLCTPQILRAWKQRYFVQEAAGDSGTADSRRCKYHHLSKRHAGYGDDSGNGVCVGTWTVEFVRALRTNSEEESVSAGTARSLSTGADK